MLGPRERSIRSRHIQTVRAFARYYRQISLSSFLLNSSFYIPDGNHLLRDDLPGVVN
jgi:hypothetical protein